MNDPKIQALLDEGVVFRLDAGNLDMTLHRMVENVIISNGIGWSADDKTTDSAINDIFQYDYDASTGNIFNRRVFFHLDDDIAVLGGFAMDVEGNLWVALCGGGKALRVSPRGEIIGEIILSTRMITCSGFVNENVFITSAEEDPEKFPDSVKLAGSLFRVAVGVAGLPLHKFKKI